MFALTADIIARARPLFLFWGISEAFELVRKGLIEIEIEVSEARARHGREGLASAGPWELEKLPTLEPRN